MPVVRLLVEFPAITAFVGHEYSTLPCAVPLWPQLVKCSVYPCLENGRTS